jgi:long-chain-alcohol oxidase
VSSPAGRPFAVAPPAGLRVVVIEKGPWRRLSELQGLELADGGSLYEGGMLATSEDTSVNILAGATLGGGTKINWAAALAAPDHVRKVGGRLACAWPD